MYPDTYLVLRHLPRGFQEGELEDGGVLDERGYAQSFKQYRLSSVLSTPFYDVSVARGIGG